jgi:flavin-dependent dehydrogenase
LRFQDRSALMQTEFDAVIVGAGPAGSTAAIRLAREGWSIALVEKQRFPRRKVCGECVAASNLPLLDSLGIGNAVPELAGPELRLLAFLRGRREVVACLPAARNSGHPWGRALGREDLDTLLVEQARLAGARVMQPWSMQEIRGCAGDWRIAVREIDSAQSAWLHANIAILANGSWEPLPAARPHRRKSRRSSDLFAFKANFSGASLVEGTLAVMALDSGYGGMVLAGHGVATVACCIRRDRLEALRRASPGAGAGEIVEAWLTRDCDAVRRALQSATRVGAWLSVGPIGPGFRGDSADGCFRIGNAAAEAHPIIGEGISMALQSADLLCRHLIDDAPDHAARDGRWQQAVGRRYRLDWRRNFAWRLRLAAVIAHLFMHPVSSSLAMSLLRLWPGLLTAVARSAGKVQGLSRARESAVQQAR